MENHKENGNEAGCAGAWSTRGRAFNTLNGAASTNKARIADYMRRRDETESPKFEQWPGSEMVMPIGDVDLARAKLSEALGTSDDDLSRVVLEQIGGVRSSKGDTAAETLNASVAAVQGIGPRDTLETLLAVQLAGLHTVSMRYLARAGAGTPEAGDPNLDLALRAIRTFAQATDALVRYRTRGQQVVRVEHVTVQAGGQAVVGVVNRPGGRKGGTRES